MNIGGWVLFHIQGLVEVAQVNTEFLNLKVDIRRRLLRSSQFPANGETDQQYQTTHVVTHSIFPLAEHQATKNLAFPDWIREAY